MKIGLWQSGLCKEVVLILRWFVSTWSITVIILPYNIPCPVVWSAEGPVLTDVVGPLWRDQSNLSFPSCRLVQPHLPYWSKLQDTDSKNKLCNYDTIAIEFRTYQPIDGWYHAQYCHHFDNWSTFKRQFDQTNGSQIQNSNNVHVWSFHMSFH